MGDDANVLELAVKGLSPEKFEALKKEFEEQGEALEKKREKVRAAEALVDRGRLEALKHNAAMYEPVKYKLSKTPLHLQRCG